MTPQHITRMTRRLIRLHAETTASDLAAGEKIVGPYPDTTA